MKKSKKRKARQPHELVVLLIVVAKHYRLSLPEIRKSTRKRKYVQPRQMYMYIAFTQMDYSLARIGIAVLKDPTTTRNGVERIRDLISSDPAINGDLGRILKCWHKVKKIPIV